MEKFSLKSLLESGQENEIRIIKEKTEKEVEQHNDIASLQV